jgi:CheY-like chemotaxis protein
MRPDEIDRLFKPFVQIETDFGKERGGWGLGLSICNNIAKRLDADIGVTSTPGQGTIFHFELDVGIEDAAHIPPPEPEKPIRASDETRLRVLVAEDDAPSRILMETLLTELGHEVEMVGNGFEAVEAAMGTHYDLLMMDSMRPGLDGIAAAEQIRNGHNGSHDVPIVACSAHVAAEAQKRYLSMGMNAFLPKPVDPEQLAGVIDELTGDHPEPVPV